MKQKDQFYFQYVRYFLVTTLVMCICAIPAYLILKKGIEEGSPIFLPPSLVSAPATPHGQADQEAAPASASGASIQDIGSWYQGIVGSVLSLIASVAGISVALVAFVLAATANNREVMANLRENSQFVSDLLSDALSPIHEVLHKHQSFLNTVQDFVQPISPDLNNSARPGRYEPVQLANLRRYVLARFLETHKGITDLREALDRFIASGHPLSHQLMSAWFEKLSEKNKTENNAVRYFEIFEKPISLEIARCVLHQIERRLIEFGDTARLAISEEAQARDQLYHFLEQGKLSLSAYQELIEKTETAAEDLLKTSALNRHVALAPCDGINQPAQWVRNNYLMTLAEQIQSQVATLAPDIRPALKLGVARALISFYRIRTIEDKVMTVTRQAVEGISLSALKPAQLSEIASKLIFFFGQQGPLLHVINHWPGYSFNLDNVFALKILRIIEEMMPEESVIYEQIEKSYQLKVGEHFNMMAFSENGVQKRTSSACLSLNVVRL